MNMIDDRHRPGGRGSGQDEPRRSSTPIDDDPLAELIRIVKEEDPFGDVLAWKPEGPAQAGADAADDTPPAGETAAEDTGAQEPAPTAEEQRAPDARQTRPQQPQQAEQPARDAAQQQRASAIQQRANFTAANPEDAPAAETQRRRGPPPLEPIALEEALREFRDAPDEQYAPAADEYDPAAVPMDDEQPADDNRAVIDEPDAYEDAGYRTDESHDVNEGDQAYAGGGEQPALFAEEEAREYAPYADEADAGAASAPEQDARYEQPAQDDGVQAYYGDVIEEDDTGARTESSFAAAYEGYDDNAAENTADHGVDEGADEGAGDDPGQPDHAQAHRAAAAATGFAAGYGHSEAAAGDGGEGAVPREQQDHLDGFDSPRADQDGVPHPAHIPGGEERQPRGRRGLYFGGGVLLGLFVLGGLFVTLFQSGEQTVANGQLPVVKASQDPAKVVPENPGGADIPNQQRLVYDRVSGDGEEPATRLVSREEAIMDQPGSKEAGRFPGFADEGGSGDAAGRMNANATNDGPPPAVAPGQGYGITPQPRRVKTLTVGPDGSISQAPRQAASGGREAAPSQQAEAVRRVAEANSGAAQAAEAPPPAVAPPARPDNGTSRTAQRAEAETAAAPPAAQARPQNTASNNTGSNNTGNDANTRSRGPIALNPNPVQARQSRVGQDSGGQAGQQPAAQQTQETSPVRQQVAAANPSSGAAPAVSSQGEYVVQLAARKSEEQARSAYSALQGQYSGLLGRYQPLIQRADLGDRGVYYRVRVGPMASSDSANQLCGQLKAAGLSDCLVRRR